MNPKNPPLKFRKAWSWPKGLENFLQTFLISPSLHVCCGESQLGDYKVDAYLIRREVIQADMFNLPFRDGFFASAIIDPPWHLQYHLRPRLAKELFRVLRPGGILLLNSPWALGLTKTMKLEAVYYAETKSWRNCPLIMVYRKIQSTIFSNVSHAPRPLAECIESLRLVVERPREAREAVQRL